MEGIRYKTRYTKEEADTTLIERGYILTKVFGWITQEDAEWINQKLKRTNLEETVEELCGIPAYETETTESKKVGGTMQTITKKSVVVYPFVYEFFERKKAKEANMRGIVQSQLI